jgi:hypothetical protein
MTSRLRVFSSVCLLAVLVSVQVMAQSPRASIAGHRATASKATFGSSNVTPSSALSFVAGGPYLSGADGANAVAIADVNGDGKPDMVVANWCAYSSCTSPGTNVGVLLGMGDGTFQPAVEYESGGLYADSVAIAQLRGPGQPLDIIVANCGSSSQVNCVDTSGSGDVSVLLGNGDGTFKTAARYSLGASGATSVAVADVNGDGKLDLVVATGSSTAGSVGVLLGVGDGTFGAEATYSSGGLSPLALAVADLNGDGKPDVVVSNQWADDTDTNSNVSVLLNDGTGKFPTAMSNPTGGFYPDSIAIADVNGDGKPDLVVANSSVGSDGGLGNVGVLLGNGNGTFLAPIPYLSGAYGAAAVAVADVNGDGIPDVVVANCSGSSSDCSGSAGNVGVLVGNGDGTFLAAVTYTSGSNYPFAVAVADVNGDGRPDIVAANCSSANCGQGAGYAGVLINTSLVVPEKAGAVLGDFNGDGKVDVLWREERTGTDAMWLMNGVTIVSSALLPTVPDLNMQIVAVGDFNGDGKADILWREEETGQNVIWFMNGTTVLSSQLLPTVSDPNMRIVGVGDFNGDGKADILWRNRRTGQNAIWLMNGATVVSSRYLPTVTDLNMQVAGVGDFNGDGKADILWREQKTGQNAMWLMNGFTIVSSQYLPTVTDLNMQVVGVRDFNGDGKADILWREQKTGQNAMWLMNGFTIVNSQYLPTVTDLNMQVVGVGDFNGDGKADILWREQQTGQNAIWLMNGTTVVSGQFLPTEPDLSWDVY